jgi:hypothetical protein
MKSLKRILVILSLTTSIYLLGQSAISLTQQDLEAAQVVYWGLTPADDGRTLYQDQVAFPDGARGYLIQELYEHQSNFYGDYTGNPAHDSLMLAREEYCHAKLVVLGRATGVEQVVLSPSRKAIFTATQFQIERILKNGDGQQVGDDITYMYPGGTFKGADGVILRTQLQGKPLHPFKANSLYLLSLDKVNGHDHPSTVYFSTDTHQVEIVAGHIYSTKRMSDPVIPNPVRYGESFETYWKRVSNFLETQPSCPVEPY